MGETWLDWLRYWLSGCGFKMLRARIVRWMARRECQSWGGCRSSESERVSLRNPQTTTGVCFRCRYEFGCDPETGSAARRRGE